MSSLFRSGEHGIYVIAQDVEAFRDDGMFVLNEKTGISTFFFVHLGQFGNDRLPVCGREIVFIVNLVVQHGRSHEGKYAEQGTSRRSSRDVLNGFGEMGKLGPWAVSRTRALDSVTAIARAFSCSLLKSIR